MKVMKDYREITIPKEFLKDEILHQAIIEELTKVGQSTSIIEHIAFDDIFNSRIRMIMRYIYLNFRDHGGWNLYYDMRSKLVLSNGEDYYGQYAWHCTRLEKPLKKLELKW